MTQFCYIEANMTGHAISDYRITEQVGKVGTGTPAGPKLISEP